MSPDQAREIAIREVAVKVREIAATCERWRFHDHGFVPIAHELREAAAVLEAQANVEEKKAAALRKLAKKCEDVGAQYDHGDPDGDEWEAWGKLLRDLLRESASKKEDAGT